VRNKRGQPMLVFPRCFVGRSQTLPVVIVNDGTLTCKVHYYYSSFICLLCCVVVYSSIAEQKQLCKYPTTFLFLLHSDYLQWPKAQTPFVWFVMDLFYNLLYNKFTSLQQIHSTSNQQSLSLSRLELMTHSCSIHVHVCCWCDQVDIDMVDPDDVFSLRSLNDGGQTVRSADGDVFHLFFVIETI